MQNQFEGQQGPVVLRNPEEEKVYLARQVEAHLAEGAESYADAVSRAMAKHRTQPIVAPTSMDTSAVVAERLALELSPEPHDSQIGGLMNIVYQKGVKSALAVVDNMNNPHIADDFHRFLSEYLKTGHEIKGLSRKAPLYKTLSLALYEVTLPGRLTEQEQHKSLKELISGMEQFYSGMLSVAHDKEGGPKHFVIELALENVGSEFSFYVAVPYKRKKLFETHLISIFPDAKIFEKHDDYNIFNETGVAVASYATLARNKIYPLRIYDSFDNDPLNVLLNSFSKIDVSGEGATIQIVLTPEGAETIMRKHQKALEKIHKGTPLKEALNISYTTMGDVWQEVSSVFKTPKKKDDTVVAAPDPQAVEAITRKLSSPLLQANIRLVASSRTQAEAESILFDMESAFNQFEDTQGNALSFKRVKGRALKRMLRAYSYRMFDTAYAVPLSLKELTTIMHLKTTTEKLTTHLKKNTSNSVAAPAGIADNGVLIGVNNHRNVSQNIYIADEDRLRHLYVIGQTGTGKSTLLKNIIMQDIARGDGVCMIDPHGSDVEDVLASIPPERFEDVIYFDPAYLARPMGLNMLEYDPAFPEQKTFVVNELFSIFRKLYGAVPESMGPAFEQYFRNATMLVLEDPSSGMTLLDVSRVLADEQYRNLKLSRCNNLIVKQFWQDIASKAQGEASLQNIVPYITNKFDVFVANDYMRPIISQEKSSINFREVMDKKKILLVNLSKGRLGDINANLLGLIVVGKLLMAALSRADSVGKDLPPFYLHIDEFQNITTDSIATILSEARKYKLSLTVAHQFIAQLEEDIRDSVFGNVGSIVSFRVGADDAEYLEKQFAPTFTAHDLLNVDNRNAFVRLLSAGRPLAPFNIETVAPPLGNREQIDDLKQLSYMHYGKERARVEHDVQAKYQKP